MRLKSGQSKGGVCKTVDETRLLLTCLFVSLLPLQATGVLGLAG